MSELLQGVTDGFGTGGVYALVALGYVVIFRTCGVLNLALGETGMVGAYVTASLLDGGTHPLVGCAAGVVVAAAVGWASQRTVLRAAIERDHLVAVLLTLGLALVLRSVTAVVFGTKERALRSALVEHTWFAGDVAIWRLYAVTLAIAVVAVSATAGMLRWTRAGRAARALTEDQPVARLMGIRSGKAFGTAFAIAAALAAIAAILSAHAGFLSQGTAHIGIRALPAVVLGGFDSVRGALIGGLAVGVAEQLTAIYIAGDLAELAPFVLLLGVLVVRPAGLFGELRLRRV